MQTQILNMHLHMQPHVTISEFTVRSKPSIFTHYLAGNASNNSYTDNDKNKPKTTPTRFQESNKVLSIYLNTSHRLILRIRQRAALKHKADFLNDAIKVLFL